MRRRLFAWLNLAWHFLLHLLRMPGRLLRRDHEAERFLDAVVPEGYIPLTPEERKAYPAFMNCIGCGLCALACPALEEAPASAWAEPASFVTGPARSIDRARLVAADVPRCAGCGGDCVAACPMDVPVARIVAMVRRLAAESHS